MRIFLSLLLLSSALFAEIRCPNVYKISQDPAKRLFHIHVDEKSLGTILSTSWGVLEFYDAEGQMCYVNEFDTLFDPEREQLVDARITNRYWHPKSTQAELFSIEEEHLFTMGPEGGRDNFVFRDPVTNQPLATAILEWIPRYSKCLSWINSDQYLQEWTVMIVDPDMLKKKNLRPIHLIWPLLKHSQRYLPSANDLPYIQKN